MNKALKIGLGLGLGLGISYLIYRKLKGGYTENELQKRIKSSSKQASSDLETEVISKTLSDALKDNAISKKEVDKYFDLMKKDSNWKPTKEDSDFIQSFMERIKKYTTPLIELSKIEQLPNLNGTNAIFKLFGVDKPIVYDITGSAFNKTTFNISNQLPLTIKDKWADYTIDLRETPESYDILFKKKGVTLKNWVIDSKTKQLK